MSASNTAAANAQNVTTEVGQLGEQVAQLLDDHVQLLKVEIKEEVSGYLRDGMILGLGGLTATIGFALFSARLPKGTGILYMLLGGATVLLMKERIAKRRLIPPGVAEELKKDRHLIQEKI